MIRSRTSPGRSRGTGGFPNSPGLIAGTLTVDDAIHAWRDASGLPLDRETLDWWCLFSHVKAMGIWLGGAARFASGRNDDLVYGLIGWKSLGHQQTWMMEHRGLADR